MRTSLTPTCGSRNEIAVFFTSHCYRMYRVTRRCRQRLRVRNELQFRRFSFDIQFIIERKSQGQIFPSKSFFICSSMGFWDLLGFFLQFFLKIFFVFIGHLSKRLHGGVKGVHSMRLKPKCVCFLCFALFFSNVFEHFQNTLP